MSGTPKVTVKLFSCVLLILTSVGLEGSKVIIRTHKLPLSVNSLLKSTNILIYSPNMI